MTDYSFIERLQTAAVAPPVGVTVTALICSVRIVDMRTLFQLRIASEHLDLLPMFSQQATVLISFPSFLVPAGLEPMDMVTVYGCHEKTLDHGRTVVNADSLELLSKWRTVVAAAANLARELVPLPLPDKDHFGRPFLVHVTDNAKLEYRSVPGLCRNTLRDVQSLSWTSKQTGKSGRCLHLTLNQCQWLTEAEAKPDAPLLKMRLTIWDQHCGQLIRDAEKWPAIMAANPVPFYALVQVDGKRSHNNNTSGGFIELFTLAVHWDLRTYLQSDHCLELTLEQVQTLLPEAETVTASATLATHMDKDGVINMTESRVIPSLPAATREWKYYAISANRAPDFERLKEEDGGRVLLYAVEFKAAKPSAAKKARLVKKEQKGK